MIEGIQLRKAVESDLELLLEWENEAGHWRFGNRTEPYHRDDLMAYLTAEHSLSKDGQERWIICSAEEENEKGVLDLFDLNDSDGTVQIGILIHETSDRRKGNGIKALEAIKSLLVEQTKVKAIHAWVQIDNVASQGLFRKASYVYRRKNERGDLLFTLELI